ncbi:hypothetical protein GALL_319150 [mine drainage metagenome]|uniref:Uncharacterized protein n=1 Tax=mine drainage metagenome TaxID=410659 RepID=A0A1J5RDL4_9ZZZZ
MVRDCILDLLVRVGVAAADLDLLRVWFAA